MAKPIALKPVFDGYFADPFVLQVGEEFYAYGTDGPDDKQDRPFKVLRSTNLKNWKLLDGALIKPKGLETASYWAPAVTHENGKFKLYYSAGGEQGEGQKLRVAESEKPEGPFRDCGLEPFPDLAFSIDPHPFRDPRSGKGYLYFARDYFNRRAGTGIAVAEVGCKPKTVLRATEEWQVYERNRQWYGKKWPKWHTLEGPATIYRNGIYYLFFSGGNWQSEHYGVGCAYSASPDRGFKYTDPTGTPSVINNKTLIGPGHCMILQEVKGRDHIVFHAWNEQRTKRQMYVTELTWEKREGYELPRAIH